MEISSDPYELKLYHMFQSCDTESCGKLDEKALWRLCGLLELRDKGAVLIAGLVVNEDDVQVSFDCFKEALLNFLGSEFESENGPIPKQHQSNTKSTTLNTMDTKTGPLERTLIISDEVATYVDSPHESSDREVLPKLVMGSKKYGRRSRPQRHTPDELSLSDSENEEKRDHGHKNCSTFNCNNKLVQRSSSHMDIPGHRRRRPTFSGGKLKRCSSLPAQRNLQSQHKLTPGKTKALVPNPDTKLLSQCQVNSSAESLSAPSHLETLSVPSIIDIWERANISNGKSILLALGFDEEEVNLAQLNKVIEEELRNSDEEPQFPLLRALLALQSAELTALRQTFRQLHDENTKLRADNKDANRRVALLAVEIDERHASLEDNSKKEIRMLEQRHAGVVRDLTTRMANDRENWNNLTARLEARIKNFEQDEMKLKSELESVRKENNELETEQHKLQKQVAELLEKNNRLNREVVNRMESSRCKEHGASEIKNLDDEMQRLIEKVSKLQVDNTNLRDKNDELVVEIENLNHELVRLKMKSKKNAAMNAVIEGDESTTEEVDQGIAAIATKRRGGSPSKARISETSPPRLGKLRKCTNDSGINESSDTSGEWIALNSELHKSEKEISATRVPDNENVEEITLLKYKITELEEQLKNLQKAGDNNTAEDRSKELEASLEQMQRAYEDCEDYWQLKLSEERQLFEKERLIYEEEQQESDKKFTDLMEKVREYEEQFSKDGRLSPIEEKDTLEQQYVELEAEAEQIRTNARLIFEEKSLEISTLQNEIEDLKQRLGESVEILTGACELNSEAAAAAAHASASNMQNSAANSPINYLWHQSTIQEPIVTLSSSSKRNSRNNLSTSETTIFSTKPIDMPNSEHSSQTVSPIQKPSGSSKTLNSDAGDVADCDTSSTASGKSFETHSVASTHSVHPVQTKNTTTKSSSSGGEQSCSSPSTIKEELKRLKFFEMSLKEQIKDLSFQRDGLVMELQQLQEARPVLEKAYARTAHPSLIQRVNQLELRNRHLQNVIKQQQQYTESLMQQSWRQHQIELADLHNRIETQGVMMAEQAQRLQNADVLVKELYVENAHLNATAQRFEQQLLEQQRVRTNLIHQRQGVNGLPGMP